MYWTFYCTVLLYCSLKNPFRECSLKLIWFDLDKTNVKSFFFKALSRKQRFWMSLCWYFYVASKEPKNQILDKLCNNYKCKHKRSFLPLLHQSALFWMFPVVWSVGHLHDLTGGKQSVMRKLTPLSYTLISVGEVTKTTHATLSGHKVNQQLSETLKSLLRLI